MVIRRLALEMVRVPLLARSAAMYGVPVALEEIVPVFVRVSGPGSPLAMRQRRCRLPGAEIVPALEESALAPSVPPLTNRRVASASTE